MKSIITTAIAIVFVLGVNAQDNAKYISAMQSNLTKMSKAKSADDYQNIYNTFERIASNESNEWEATYYMAFIKTVQAFEAKDKTAAEEPLSLLTEKLKAKIDMPSLAENQAAQSEIHALIAMMYSARMMANPMELGQKFMPLNGKHLGMAERLNKENPRVWLLQAQNLFYTPEAFGGNKRKSKDLAQKAIELYSMEGRERIPQRTIMPTWGLDQAEGLLKELEKEEKK